MTQVNMKNVKALHEQALREVYPNDQHMIDWSLKQVSDYVILDDGSFLTIDKPHIEKSFCFGYSLSKWDNEDYNRAGDMAKHAKESENYFLKENLKNIDEHIHWLNSDECVKVVRKEYWRSSDDSPMKALEYVERYKWNYDNLYDKTQYRELSKEELQRTIDGYESARNKFVKRLNTYLKKYGMSKVRTWTYWQDE